MADAPESDIVVVPGLRALLEDIVDYAGLFPPTCLSLDEAVENYARYRSDRDAWMLGRFVMPAARLSELDYHAELLESDPPFRLSMLLGRSDDAEAFVEAVVSDLESVAAFRRRHDNQVLFEMVEMRLPSDLLRTDVVTVGRFISDVAETLERYDLRSAAAFFEIPLDQNCRQTATILTGALSSFNRARTADEDGRAGLKMRTGGTEPESIPPAERVAHLIAACNNAGIPFKATAGLHHPLRHFDEDVGAPMHGFLNLFVAATLGATGMADENDLIPVLLEEDMEAFSFTEAGIEWNGHRAPVEDVAKARRDRAVSFGSCSFSEPTEDLRALGLL